MRSSSFSKIIAFIIFLAMAMPMLLHLAAQLTDQSQTSKTLASEKKKKGLMGFQEAYRCPFGCCGRRTGKGVYCYCCAYPTQKIKPLN